MSINQATQICITRVMNICKYLVQINYRNLFRLRRLPYFIVSCYFGSAGMRSVQEAIAFGARILH